MVKQEHRDLRIDDQVQQYLERVRPLSRAKRLSSRA